jgi:hypothetical protein
MMQAIIFGALDPFSLDDSDWVRHETLFYYISAGALNNQATRYPLL